MTKTEKEFLDRAIKFINIAAGEGIWFKDQETYVDEFDAACILYDFHLSCDSKYPDWYPEAVKKEFSL